MSGSTGTGTRRLDAAVLVSAALAVGSALLSVAHLGVGVPVLSALGPGGDRAVLPAAIAFAVAAVLHGATSAGLARRRAWAWPLGVLIAAMTVLGAAMPFRGAVSALGIALAAVQLWLLLSGQTRRALLPTDA